MMCTPRPGTQPRGLSGRNGAVAEQVPGQKGGQCAWREGCEVEMGGESPDLFLLQRRTGF